MLRLLKWCDKTGSHPSARSPQRPGWFAVQSRPDTEHWVDDGHGASLTSVSPVGRSTGWLVRDIHQQMRHQVCPISGPQGGVHGHHVGSLGQREGSPVRISAIQDGPSSPAEGRSVSRCSDDSDPSSAGNSFLVPGTSGPVPRRSLPTARWRSKPQPLLTQDVALSEGGVETRHYWPSNLHAWRLCRPS